MSDENEVIKQIAYVYDFLENEGIKPRKRKPYILSMFRETKRLSIIKTKMLFLTESRP